MSNLAGVAGRWMVAFSLDAVHPTMASKNRASAAICAGDFRNRSRVVLMSEVCYSSRDFPIGGTPMSKRYRLSDF
jgi:hypothetical protein